MLEGLFLIKQSQMFSIIGDKCDCLLCIRVQGSITLYQRYEGSILSRHHQIHFVFPAKNFVFQQSPKQTCSLSSESCLS